MKAIFILAAIVTVGLLCFDDNSKRQQLKQLKQERDQLIQERDQARRELSKATPATGNPSSPASKPTWFQNKLQQSTNLGAPQLNESSKQHH